MTKKIRKPHYYKKRKPIYCCQKFWWVCLFLVLFSILIYFLVFSDFFQIKKININYFDQKQAIESREVDQEEIKALIDQETRNEILFFPDKNIFLIKLIKAKEKALEKFPQIAEIKISRKLPDSLNVLIQERKSLAIICFLDQNCFALDDQGVVFETRKSTENLIIITDQRNFDDIVLTKQIINQEELAKIQEIDSFIKNNLNISINKIILSPEKLIIETEQGWQIYFDLKADTSWQLVKLRVVLEEKISEQQRQDLEYIELRFNNFANPKYKNNN